MGQMLTAKQVAEVKGCSYQYIKRIIKEGKLQAKEVLNDKNRKTYLVPLETLDEELQQKWYQMNREKPPEDIAIAKANTGTKVFIASNVKFVNAMEDLKMNVNM